LKNNLIADKMFPSNRLSATSVILPYIDWDGTKIERRYHQGRTDANFGHHDYNNISGLGPYHYHHTMGPHIPCDHFDPQGESLIDLIRKYDGDIWTMTSPPTDGRLTYSFHAAFVIKPTKNIFGLDITGQSETSKFYVFAESLTTVEPFFGTPLNPKSVKRVGSLWSGAKGGFDYLVNAEYFHAMVNRHTGLPNPDHTYVTMEMMREFGWQENLLTSDYMLKLNNCLEFFGITNKISMKLFLATCGHESGKGKETLENLRNDSTTEDTYKPYERGAGYIQITWRDANHLPFLASVDDDYKEMNTAEYISENYPWEASAWYWATAPANFKASLKPTSNITLNDFIIMYGDSLFVYLLVQYAVNGWPEQSPTGAAAKSVLDGAEWYIENGRLFISGDSNSYTLPTNWEDREKNYNDAISVFI
jgi:predicted chitinase